MIRDRKPSLRSFSGTLRVTGVKTEPSGCETGQPDLRNGKNRKLKFRGPSPTTIWSVADGLCKFRRQNSP
ncbi:hypothetical protein HanIR_Chr10g0476251 [Helianthus annuus]|nr:hypothetical protein HanIR_Chr10g0476251 [Helianthus annuus]